MFHCGAVVQIKIISIYGLKLCLVKSNINSSFLFLFFAPAKLYFQSEGRSPLEGHQGARGTPQKVGGKKRRKNRVKKKKYTFFLIINHSPYLFFQKIKSVFQLLSWNIRLNILQNCYLPCAPFWLADSQICQAASSSQSEPSSSCAVKDMAAKKPSNSCPTTIRRYDFNIYPKRKTKKKHSGSWCFSLLSVKVVFLDQKLTLFGDPCCPPHNSTILPIWMIKYYYGRLIVNNSKLSSLTVFIRF